MTRNVVVLLGLPLLVLALVLESGFLVHPATIQWFTARVNDPRASIQPPPSPARGFSRVRYGVFALPVLGLLVWLAFARRDVPSVSPVTETSPMQGRGDVADDICVWVHPTDGSRSVLFGSNKSDQRDGGIYAFRLDGSAWNGQNGWQRDVNWFDAGKKINNIDSCRGVPAGRGEGHGERAARWDLVAAGNRTDHTVDVFRAHTDAQGDFSRLELLAQVPIGPGFEGHAAPYGLALTLTPALTSSAGPNSNAAPARCMVFISSAGGRVAQFELQLNPGAPPGPPISARRWDAFGQPWQISETGEAVEGIVADARHGVVYLASEAEGVFRYRLKDGVLDPQSKVVVDRIGPRVKPDVEGLTLFTRPDGSGYLIASSQGSSEYAVYDREFRPDAPNAPVMNFRIGRGTGMRNGRTIGPVNSTDGIDLVSVDLGGAFRDGLLIAHDGQGESPTNYKLVPWSSIAKLMKP